MRAFLVEIIRVIMYIRYVLSTNRKYPFWFLLSMLRAFIAISESEGSPFSLLSRSVSKSICEYANKPGKLMETFVIVVEFSRVVRQNYTRIYFVQIL